MYRESLGIEQKDIISITGAGGKTTLMLNMASELRESKTLITTTTKIFLPQRKDYDYLYISCEPIAEKVGLYICGNSIKNNKIIGSDSRYYDRFDYVLIEADGANGKFLKGWNETEPVIVKETTKTIGVLSLKLLGRKIDKNDIHRVAEYTEITESSIGGKITAEQLARLVLHKNGLFKNSVGEKILFVNIYEEFHKEAVYLLAQRLKPRVSRIVTNDLKRGTLNGIQ